jgi:hypothetical protein
VPAPSSSTDIVNLAVLKLYQGAITSIQDPNNNAAGAALLIYDQCRRSLIRNFEWNFARMRAFAPLVPTYIPAFDYLYAYARPTDLLRIQFIGYDRERFDVGRHELQQNYILTNLEPANSLTPDPSIPIIYSQDVSDVTQMDALFIDVLVLSMASELCMPITGDVNLLGALEAKLKQKLAEAVAINHQERPVVVTERQPIAISRWAESWPTDPTSGNAGSWSGSGWDFAGG